MVKSATRIAMAVAAAMPLAGCTVYRFSSPDYPAKMPAATVAAASRLGENGKPARFHVAKVRGSVYGGSAGRLSFSPEDLNDRLTGYWPTLFDGGESAESSIPLTVELGGNLALYAFGGPPGDIGLEIALILMGTLRMESQGEITARVLVENAVWSDKTKAEVKCNSTLNSLFLPLPYLVPPYKSDWPSDSHVGGMGYTNAKETEQIATDLAAVAILKAVAGLTPQQVATIKGKALLNEAQLTAKKRLKEGAQTFAAVGSASDTVSFVKASHEFKADASPAARDIPEVIEQRYDERTRRGLVRADMSGCDAELAYRHLTTRLIPAICETRNIVLDVDSPPPAHALFRTLGERKEEGSGILAIEFEALQ